MFKDVLLNGLLTWHLCGKARRAGKTIGSDQEGELELGTKLTKLTIVGNSARNILISEKNTE
jgi:hypothetical protein